MKRRDAGGSVRVVLFPGLAAALFTIGCSDQESHPGPRAPEPVPIDVEAGQDAPVDLSYVCGNIFLVSNAHAVPVSVRYRVSGSGEEGIVDVAAAPEEDPAVSEAMFETRTRGTVQIFLDGKPLVARANDGVPCTPAPGPSFSVAPAGESGSWTAPFPWPIVSVHMVLLPDGKVLTVGRWGTPQIWDPETGAFTPTPSPTWLFCAGHALLPDGTVFFAGGHISDNHGIPDITLFSATSGWTTQAPMALGRWYPTTTVMGDGSVVILAGRDQAGLQVTLPEVWKNGSIRRLTGAGRSLPYYPRAFLTAKGQVYVAGPAQATRYLSTANSGGWKGGPSKGMAREYGSAVMYDEGKILYAGGARTTNTAEIINLNQTSPVWTWTGSMAFARRHHNLTVLPTGEVLATGGVAGTTFNDISKGVRAAEIWNPGTGQWTVLASNAVTRGYHGTSLLLPDGRVLNSGSGDGGAAPAEKNAEIFSPPYLFRSARPVISSVPTTVQYGAKFRIETEQAGEITRVSLIRLGAVTHAFDENQRFQRLGFVADATGLTVTTPSLPNRTPPGHYLVFILNGDDVPSVGKIVRIH
jgi:hypothetical protein